MVWSQDLHQAACDGNISQLDSLLQTSNIDLKNGTESTPLHIAAFCRQTEAVRYLVNQGAKVNATNQYDETPLYYAIRARDSVMVKGLLDKGAKINILNFENISPFFRAVQFDNPTIIKLLLSKGADVNLGTSSLHDAVLNNSPEVLKMAINDSTEIDPINDYGHTPLTIALRQESNELIEILLSKGADTTKVKEYVLNGPYAGQSLPDTIATVFARGFISTEDFVHTLAFNPEQTEIYYTLESGLMHGGTIMVTRLIDGKWTQPKPSDISGNYREIDPYITTDGTKLFYSSNRPVNGVEDPANIDLWMIDIEGESWGEPVHLGDEVNTEYLDWFPTVSDYGNLFFSTGPNRSSNIVKSQILDGKFQKGVSLGDSVNSTFRDYDPLIAPDESFMIFSSNREGGYGSVDLYISYRKGNGDWTKAVNMGETVNSPRAEFASKLSFDGSYLFFNRGGEIFWIDASIIEKLNPLIK